MEENKVQSFFDAHHKEINEAFKQGAEDLRTGIIISCSISDIVYDAPYCLVRQVLEEAETVTNNKIILPILDSLFNEALEKGKDRMMFTFSQQDPTVKHLIQSMPCIDFSSTILARSGYVDKIVKDAICEVNARLSLTRLSLGGGNCND